MPRRRGKVVSLHGGAIPLPQRDADVVSKAKEILGYANDGQAVGLIYGMVSPEGHISTGWVGKANAHNMLSAAAILEHRIKVATAEE